MKHKIFLLLSAVIISGLSIAQPPEINLSLDELTAIVKKYHPIAKQAVIQIDQAIQDIRISRGAFDPTFNYTVAEKTFDGTSYYAYQQTQLNIPTWFGVTLKTGVEQVNGNRVNPTETIGQSSYLGIQIPLGRDLLTDKRRTDLQKAKIAKEASYAVRRKMLNDVLLEAHSSYFEWYQHYRIFTVAKEALEVVRKRLDFVRISIKGGDRPAIDTTEAAVQLQLFEMQWNIALVNLKKSQWKLSQYLWQEEQTPFILPDNCRPTHNEFEKYMSTQNLLPVDSLLSIAANNHPELVLFNFKLNGLAVEKRYRAQQLLPKATFNYNFLERGFQWTTPKTVLFENNFQYGVTLNIPLRLSAERGEFKKILYTVQSTTLEQDLKKVQIENNIRASYFEVENLKKQIVIQEKVFTNNQALLRGEELRFKVGESSLFLVNARESRVWEAAQKVEEIKAKLLIALQKLNWTVGILN